MNYNSFPTGERAAGPQEQEEKYPTFSEHIIKMDIDEQGKLNRHEFRRPSLKNQPESDGSAWMLPYKEVMEGVEKKLKKGDNLNPEDIKSLVGVFYHPEEGSDEKMEEFLEKSGIAEGRDFDVRTPGYLYGDSGRMETPLQISFKNKQRYKGGESYTLISFSRGLKGEIRCNASIGSEDEGYNLSNVPMHIRMKDRSDLIASTEL